MFPELRKQNQLERIEEKRETLRNPAVSSVLSNIELMAAKTAIGKPVGLYPEGELFARGLALAVTICRDLGINQSQDDMKYHSKRFVETLRDYYSGFTLEQVNEAFRLFVLGALDEFLPKDKNKQPDRNHYQSFSMLFVSKVLIAFGEYNNKIWAKAVRAIPEPEITYTEEEKNQAKRDFRKAVGDYYVEYLEAGIVDIMFPFYVADYLVENGLAEKKPLEQRHFDTARIILRDRPAEEKRVLFEGFETGNFSERLRNEALRLLALEVIRESFEKLKNDGVQDDYWK